MIPFFKNIKTIWLAILALVFIPNLVFAHEEYVLTKSQINTALSMNRINALDALNKIDNLKVALAVTIASLIVVILYFLFQQSKLGKKVNEYLISLDSIGHTVLRIALASSLILAAYHNSFLGPEISLSTLPLGMHLKPLLYILGGLLFFGLWTELVGIITLSMLLLTAWVYKIYILTYFNYLGEFIALILFGSRIFSLDKLVYNTKTITDKQGEIEMALIRITYGISVIYPAVIYKIIHPQVIIDIVKLYNLTQFSWLFPHDPLLIALGTGLTQITVGLFIIFGFQTRLNTLVTFVLMFFSVMFFKEAVWPHVILLALAFYLFLNNGGRWSLDNYFQKKLESHEQF